MKTCLLALIALSLAACDRQEDVVVNEPDNVAVDNGFDKNDVEPCPNDGPCP